MSEDEFLGRYGPWDAMTPAEVAAELAAHTVAGVSYVRPEVALLFKARQGRDKDRADLAAARLSEQGRAWLAATSDRLGYAEWARLLRQRRLAHRHALPGGCGSGPPMTGLLPQPPPPRRRQRGR